MPRPRRDDLKGPFNDDIRAKMDEWGWTKLEQFADHYRIGRTTVYALVLGRQSSAGEWVKPSLDTLIRLAIALEKPVEELLERLYPEIDLPKAVGAPASMADVSVLGFVGAGPGQEALISDGSVYVSRRFARGKDLVAYRVRGDSMCGGKRPICDGDTIVVNREDKGASGSPVVARLKDGTHVCKALKEDKFGRRLMSLNPLYTNATPPVIPADDVAEIIGKVVMVQGEVGKLEE